MNSAKTPDKPAERKHKMSANAPDTVQLPRLGYGDLEGDGSVGGAAAGDGGTGLSPPPPSSSSSPSSSWLSWPTLAARILLLLLLASLEGGVMEVSSTAVEKEPGRGKKKKGGVSIVQVISV